MYQQPSNQLEIDHDLESQNTNEQDTFNHSNENKELTNLSFASGSIKNNFIRKVYSIIAAQLSLTALFIIATVFSFNFASVVMTSSALFGLSFLAILIPQIILFCSREQARTVPNNYILLSIFTIGFSYFVAANCAGLAWTMDGKADLEGQQIILSAAFMTAGITIGLTAYAFTTKKDFTVYGGILFSAVWGIFLLGLIAMFSGIAFLYNLYLWAGVMVYSIYLVYDTQLLCEDKSRNLSIDDYIIGAMIIYTDIVILFIRILRILAQSKRR